MPGHDRTARLTAGKEEVVRMAVFTLGIWTVKSGREPEFIAAWNALANATASDFPGASAMLLQDRDNRSLFVSSGPWESLEQIEAWRGSETFGSGVGRIRDLVDSFEPHTMDLAASVG
jgi:heme-degrading monooxygenase HmoA